MPTQLCRRRRAPSPARGKGLNPTNPVDVTSAWTTPNCSVPLGALTMPGTRRSVSAPLPSVRNRLNRRSSLSVATSALDADARSTSLPRRASIKPRRSARACVSGSAVSSAHLSAQTFALAPEPHVLPADACVVGAEERELGFGVREA